MPTVTTMSKKSSLSPKLAALQGQLQQAMHWHQSGQLPTAELLYREVLTAHPRHVDALHLLGVLCVQTGRAAEGVQLISQAVKLHGTSAAMHSNLGNALLANHQTQEALRSFQRALALEPRFVDALTNQGNALRELGRPAEALVSLDKALALRPDLAAAWSNRGNALHDLGRHAEAVDSFDKALGLAPTMQEAWNSRGVSLTHLDRLTEALESYDRALALAGPTASIFNNRGNTLRELGRLADARNSYEQALTHEPEHADALSNLGMTLLQLGHADQAVQACRQALRTAPDHPRARSNLLYAMSQSPEASSADYLEEARAFGQWLCASHTPMKRKPRPPLEGRPLRVGLVSGDLRQHPIGYFMEGLLAELPAARVVVEAFSTRAEEDALTARLQQHCHAWHTIGGMSAAEAAQLIDARQIDVLVDLAGHTAGNMLDAFALRPAPVQASWLGYLASTGLPTIDWILVDPATVPADQDSQFSERVWRLPHTANCFTPPMEVAGQALTDLPALTRGHVTFGCAQSLHKVHDGMLRRWATLLARLPSARLVLQSPQFVHEIERQQMAQRLLACGLQPDRVTIRPGERTRSAHLLSLSEVDVQLDTFPYPGITTTCEALWMGTPVLTQSGQNLLQNQGMGLMRAIGLPEWVAQDETDYVERAVTLTQDLSALARLRQGMRERLLASPLFKPEDFAPAWIEALEGMARSTSPMTLRD